MLAMPHLDAAYNLARWLVRDDHLAEDLVQEACLRAFRFLDDLQGEDARAWLMRIVRNTCFSWLRSAARAPEIDEFDEERDSDAEGHFSATQTPETILLQKLDRLRINSAIASLAPCFREAIVLRELENLSYEDIATITGVPIGTVMSRLSRARRMLREALAAEMAKG